MEKAPEKSPVLDGKEIKLLVGNEVMDLIFDPVFQNGWNILFQSCPWATVFQSPEFVTEWYSLYQHSYDPILIYAYSEGRLTGMLALAGGNNGKRIMAAGRNEAHYQGWISEGDNKESFMIEALEEFRKVYKREDINLTHLPPNAPMDWIHDHHLGFYCNLKPFLRPLIKLDRSTVDQLMRKKQYRENRNRLNRLGELRLEKITDITHFESVLHELALQYDFRQGAMYSHTPFKNNSLKKTFYINLFKKGLIYVTVLWLDKEIIASVIGTVGVKGYIHGAGINSQSPYYKKLSPGFMNFIMFAEQVHEDGHQLLDLSTGGQSYKYRLGNAFDTVYALYISFDPNKGLVRNARSQIQNFLNRGLEQLDINPERLKASYEKNRMLINEKLVIIRKHGAWPWIKNKLLWTINKKYYLRKIRDDLYTLSQFCVIKKNSIKDLLDFEPDAALITKGEFLYSCMERIEAGDVPYTWTMNGKLLACIWVADDNDGFVFDSSMCQNDGIQLQGLYLYNKGSRNADVFLPTVKMDNIRTALKYST